MAELKPKSLENNPKNT